MVGRLPELVVGGVEEGGDRAAVEGGGGGEGEGQCWGRFSWKEKQEGQIYL